jgi:uncharacterized delta-60 repeat protein
MQTSATNVTFRVTFSEPVTGVGAPDFGTTVTGQLSAGTITVATISTTVYDVKVPVDGNGSVQLRIAATASIVDASGKQCDKEIVNGEEYWITQARFLSVWPQSGVTVNSTKVSYELPMRLTSGTATWTRTGGTADPASPHVQALSGDERNDGVHESITLANNPVLVNGAIYIITFNGVAWDGQVAPEFSITDIFFDRSFTYAEPDPAFNPGEGTIDVRSIALQTDNKIIIGGGFTDFDGTARNHVARLNSDGSLDASFDPGSGANNLVSTVLVQPDSKILIAGMFTQYNETNSSGIVRVNPDGSLDNTFNSDIGNLEVSTIVLQGDKVVIGGYSFLGLEPTLVRLNANGSTDDSFDVGEGPEGRVTCMFAQPDGKVMVGGRFGAYKSFFTSGIVRVNTDGAVSEDFYFDYDALDFNDDLESITAMVSQGDGKIIVSALSSFFDGSTEYISRIFRLNADGTADETFNIAEIAIYDLGEKAMVNAMQLQQDGKILIVGYFEKCNGENRYSIARLNADGTLDQSFYPNPGADNSIYALQTQTDGNILIGGGFSTYNSQYAPGIARIDPVSPIVVSSVRHTPTTPITNATSVTFRVTFSEPVTDVGVNDFIITQSGEITYGTTEVIGVSGAVYDVTVSSITGVGTLRLDVPNTASISDVVGNSFDALFETGESYNIGKGDQTITLEAIADKTEGDDAFTVTATSSSGLPVTISAVSDKVSIAGSVVTIHAAGRVSIMANQPGNDDYNAAPPVEVGFCIKPARPVITASLADPTQPVLTSSVAAGNQWYLNNASIAAATDKSYTVTAPGAYKVQAQVNDCISEFSADYVLVITGLLEDIGEKVTIYPNPARDIIAVKGITPEEKLRVIGVTGNTYDVTPENGDGLPTVNIAGLAPGVYVLQVTQQENVRTIRFIKE